VLCELSFIQLHSTWAIRAVPWDFLSLELMRLWHFILASSIEFSMICQVYIFSCGCIQLLLFEYHTNILFLLVVKIVYVLELFMPCAFSHHLGFSSWILYSQGVMYVFLFLSKLLV
jgi:hypothetical protein